MSTETTYTFQDNTIRIEDSKTIWVNGEMHGEVAPSDAVRAEEKEDGFYVNDILVIATAKRIKVEEEGELKEEGEVAMVEVPEEAKPKEEELKQEDADNLARVLKDSETVGELKVYLSKIIQEGCQAMEEKLEEAAQVPGEENAEGGDEKPEEKGEEPKPDEKEPELKEEAEATPRGPAPSAPRDDVA